MKLKIDENYKREFNSVVIKILINTQLDFRELNRNVNISIVIKFDNSRVTYQRVTLQNFSLKQWLKQVKILLKAKHKRFQGYDFQMYVKVFLRFKSFSFFFSTQNEVTERFKLRLTVWSGFWLNFSTRPNIFG